MLTPKSAKTLRKLRVISKNAYKSIISLHADGYNEIAESHYFNAKWYRKTYFSAQEDMSEDPVTHYLTKGWKIGCNPSAKFNNNAYLSENPDVMEANMAPLLHYERFGKNEKRCIRKSSEGTQKLSFTEKISFQMLKSARFLRLISDQKYDKAKKYYVFNDYRLLHKSAHFDNKYYAAMYKCYVDPIDHYLHIGYKLGYNPSPSFDNDFYLATYADILACGMNPLYHYEIAGKKEGRMISTTMGTPINYSDISFPNSVLIVSHELSLTGAPIVLLNALKSLKKNGINPVVLSPKYGELENELNANDIDYIVDPYLMVKLYRHDKGLNDFLASFPTIFFNTIDTMKFAKYIRTSNRKIVWIHEGELGYQCASESFDVAEALRNMDEIYSVGAYSKSYTDNYAPLDKSKILLYGVDDLHVDIPQTDEKLTFAIFGVCCMRKGTDYFVEAVTRLPEEIRRNCLFKVIGRIDNDDFCMRVKQLAEGHDIVFTGQLTHDETMMEMAKCDVIVCPSLDDPMPTVCTEAMQLRKVVICSNHTGTAAFIRNGVNGYTFNIENEQLSDVMTRVYNERNNIRNIGRNGYETYRQNFSQAVFEKNLMSIFVGIPMEENNTSQHIQVHENGAPKKQASAPRKKCQILVSSMFSSNEPTYRFIDKKYIAHISENTGNAIIAEFATRPLNYDFITRHNWSEDSDVDEYMIAAANTLRPTAQLSWDKWFNLFKKLEKPLHVIGLGTQATLEEMNAKEYVKTLPEKLVRWAHLVAEHCKVIGVRGEFTADVLHEMGINNVEPVGCPTWYVNGYNQPEIRKKEWGAHLKPAFYTCWEPYSDWHVAWHRAMLDNVLPLTDPKFVMQSEFDFVPYMLGNKDPMQLLANLSIEDFKKSAEAVKKHFGLSDYDIYENEKIKNMFRIFSNIDEWQRFTRTRDFQFGFRIHGSVIAMKNGVPAICVVSDSRMYEMCKLYHIPFIAVNEIASGDLNLEKIYNEADYSELNKQYPALLNNYINFLNKNNISHNFN